MPTGRRACRRVADLDGAALVFAATGSEETDRAIQALAHEAGVPVNVVDRPELCDFYTPAIVNRAPLAVAIGSEGVAPVLVPPRPGADRGACWRRPSAISPDWPTS